jgi:hypothetical protein
MDHQQVTDALTQALSEIQSCSGRSVSQITSETRPIGDLEGFDSVNAVETAAILSGHLGQPINPKIMLSTNPNEPLRICDIVDRIVCGDAQHPGRGT